MAGSSKELESEIFALIRPRLERMGMRKRAGRIFTFPLGPGSSGSIAFPARLDRIEVHIMMSVNVGVQLETLERTVAGFQGIKYHPYVPGSLATPLRALAPQLVPMVWKFTNETNNAQLGDEILMAIETIGVPWAKTHATLDAVIETGFRMRKSETLAYRTPVALLLSGREEEARTFLQDQLRSMGHRTDPAAVFYRAFTERFLEHLAVQGARV